MPETRGIDLSVVIPLYEEEENVAPLCRRILQVFDELSLSCELVLVDDGSQDATWREIERQVALDGRVRGIKLRRNYGQTAAMQAGFDHARGRIVVTMDGDLQNDPEDIPRLLEKLDEGYGVVCGWRKDRQDSLWSRNFPSWVANWLIRRLTRVPIHDTGCSLKAYRREVLETAHFYGEQHRFIPAMLAISGARIAEIVVRHHPRQYGRSKYGWSRVWKVLSDLIVVNMLLRFSYRPSRWFSLMSLPFWFAWLMFLVLAVLRYSSSTQGPPPLVYAGGALLCAFAALNLTGTGLFAELVVASRVHDPLGAGGQEIQVRSTHVLQHG